MSAIAALVVLGSTLQTDSLGQLLCRKSKTGRVATGIRELAQSVEKPERLKYGRIDADADGRITLFDPLQGGAAGERALGYDARGQAATAPGIAEVLSQLTQAAPHGGGGAMGGGHGM
jgi:hypothetical protein